ncbi:family 78 glycoside hydrolase catalytic domain [Hyunsoonleella sp. SJ7]|uniref:alpha-L-rhamnosidase n=1 Tax=Hyunsoonleella aquatilis TaxID=2762758 RepID=A0A923HAC8_9FLAO|nr:family 78 glycoside hydrolase catalytic domain [Hyunsoonleella aquatilis]MBC3758674.1 family 78 glycoside hydrolase catalytic domain [Hyunsoonleella aquatilis]
MKITPITTRFSSLVIIIAFFSLVSCKPSPITIEELKCEYLTNPLGIDNLNPRFSWIMVDAEKSRGQKQTAYQVLVASSLEQLNTDVGDVWDSGKIKSNQSINNRYQGKSLESSKHYFWKVKIWDTSGLESRWSEVANFSMGLLNPEDWKGEWIYKEDQNKKDHNWYRKNVSLDEAPQSAYIHVASFGYHELYVNGNKVVDGVMNPVNSFFKKRLPYLTYDIKDYLEDGDNVIGIWHAAGWARWGRVKDYFDPPFVFKAQANIDMGEGTITLVSDASWKCKKSYSSYHSSWDILDFGGEIIDERLREDDWNTAEYDDSNWANAVVFDEAEMQDVDVADINLGPKGAIRAPSTDANPPTSKITATLSSQMVEPQVKFKEVTPIDVTKNEEGHYVIDMGENYTGYFEMNLFNGKAGDTVTFEIADHKEVSTSWEQRSKYIYDETGMGHFTNRFNLAGGRYVTVYGINYKPELKDIKGYVITNNRKQISQFESSSELLNKIYQVNLNTYIANTIDGILVDCPHRERRGWGEVTVAAMYGDALPNFESGAYMMQYAQFMQDAQADDGKMRAVINGDDFEFLMWMANSPITIWETYRMLGDKQLLENHYPTLKKWMQWLYEHSNYDTQDALKIGERGTLEFPGLGDWCTPRGNFWTSSNSPESEHFNNCVYAFMLESALEIAKTLNKEDDVKLFSDRLEVQRNATHKKIYDEQTGKYGEGHQVNQAFALLSGVTPESEKQKVYDNLVDQVLYKFPYYDTGSSGQALYTRYFIEHGERMDLIYELLKDKRHPSYGYFLEQGKTVWPERWSAIGNSQIHTCYTGIGGYFIKGFAGVRPDPEHPGMQQFVVKPAPVGDLTYVNASYQSPYGEVVSNWKITDETATFHIEIPVNTSAKIYIPANEKESVFEGEIHAEKSDGIRYINSEKSDAVGNYIIFEVASGVYNFEVSELPKVTYPEPLNIPDNLALIGRMNASSMTIDSEKLPLFEAFRANDKNLETHWKANTKFKEWLEIEWFKQQTFNNIVIQEEGDNILSYKIQYLENGNWKDVASNSSLGSNKSHEFDAVTSTKCRIYINSSKDKPAISEFKIFHSK